MTKPATIAKNKYNAKNYDRVALQVKKGAKDIIQQTAENNGESINGYIKKAIKEKIKSDTGKDIDL